MANTSAHRFITPRDMELFAAIDRYAPLTALQLKILSQTWQSPYGSARLVRDRLCLLAKAGLVSAHPYAVLNSTHPENYYLLTRKGYQLLHGPDALPPRKRQFSPIGLSRHVHQRAVSDFIVHTVRGAHLSRLELLGYRPDNTVQIEAGGQTIYPDSSFLIKRGEEHFCFYLEMDCGTERVESEQAHADSIERKLRTYDAFMNSTPNNRFRVLFVSARNSMTRLEHILAIANRIKSFANRPLVYGVTLANYLSQQLAVTSPIFLDSNTRKQPLVPDIKVQAPHHAGMLLAVP